MGGGGGITSQKYTQDNDDNNSLHSHSCLLNEAKHFVNLTLSIGK